MIWVLLYIELEELVDTRYIHGYGEALSRREDQGCGNVPAEEGEGTKDYESYYSAHFIESSLYAVISGWKTVDDIATKAKLMTCVNIFIVRPTIHCAAKKRTANGN